MDGIDVLIQSEKEGINPQFTDLEKETLVEHFFAEKLNQYYDVVIKKVLTDRNIAANKEFNVGLGMLNFTTKVSKGLFINNKDNEDIIANAGTIYKFLMLVDLNKLDNTGF